MAQITIHPIIYPGFRRSDGTYAVRLRVTVNRKSRQISTSIFARPEQLTRSLRPKDRELSRQIDELVQRMRRSVQDIDPVIVPSLTVDDVIRYMEAKTKSESFCLDFFEFSRKVIGQKAARNKKSAANYQCAVRAFADFCGTDKLDINKMTSSLMRRFEDHLCSKYGEGARAVSLYTSSIAYIHAQARRLHNNEESGSELIRNPFEFYKPKKQKPAPHRALSADGIQKLINAYPTMQNNDRLTAAMFLFSFATMGMNLIDIYSAEKPDKSGVIVYQRSKTKDRRYDNAEMHVLLDKRVEPIVKEFGPIVKEFGGRNRMLFRFEATYSSYVTFYQAVCRRIGRAAKAAGITEHVTFYSARHTWATTAYKIGIEKGVINDCLCHIDEAMKVTDIYIEKDWDRLWEANRRVLDCFDWSPLSELVGPGSEKIEQ